MIIQLTAEQEALIPVYQEKWRAIALSSEPVDYHTAKEVMTAAYAAMGSAEPTILFCDSPYEALKMIVSQPENQLGKFMVSQLWNELTHGVQKSLREQLNRSWNHLHQQLVNPLFQIRRQIERQLWEQTLTQENIQLREQMLQLFSKALNPGIWASACSWYDFCISALNLSDGSNNWEVSQSIAKHCGWIFPFEKISIICERPIKISCDPQNRLHAEGEPAIQFSDGFNVYLFQGVWLPQKYRMHPQKWQPHWILEESNAELRRVLIQGIGYERIASAFQAEELDTWQGYTLLKIPRLDIETIYLLKMTCPSTGSIYTLRVPPDMRSAREAISWINWGVDPEDFLIQT